MSPDYRDLAYMKYYPHNLLSSLSPCSISLHRPSVGYGLYLFIYCFLQLKKVNSTKEGISLVFFTMVLKLEPGIQCVFNQLSNKNNIKMLQKNYKHERWEEERKRKHNSTVGFFGT